MFRSGFDSHLRMQNFEMNAMVAFKIYANKKVNANFQKIHSKLKDRKYLFYNIFEKTKNEFQKILYFFKTHFFVKKFIKIFRQNFRKNYQKSVKFLSFFVHFFKIFNDFLKTFLKVGIHNFKTYI